MNNREKPSKQQKQKGNAERATPRDDVPPVGQVLRRAREHHEFGLREVGRRIGRSSAYLSQIERGLIRQPDPAVLLALAELYKLDFMTLAKWAGWTDEPEGSPDRGNSATLLVRRVLELDDSQRTEILGHIEKLFRDRRT
jgi:HTH-type transcriptional regulator, competence development regulator